jgi:hypothetical protein
MRSYARETIGNASAPKMQRCATLLPLLFAIITFVSFQKSDYKVNKKFSYKQNALQCQEIFKRRRPPGYLSQLAL